ncbi:MAG: xanthine dehydrogenase family protein molybdopterin-binding subunit [Candidatus Krumholzibacteriota bacterium]
MSRVTNLSRRDFLKATAAATGALVLGFRLGQTAQAAEAGDIIFNPNAWLEITNDGDVIIQVPWSELGQGALTAVPMLLADELEVDFDTVQVRKAKNDPRFGNMGTGGSRSVRTSWDPVRTAGATARVMLVAAAAEQWQVPVAECEAKLGVITHKNSGQSLTFGEVAAAAATLEVPEDIALKPRSGRTIIGRDMPRKDTPDKVIGKAEFGCDQRIDGMVFATVARSPVLEGTVKSFDDTAALKVPGVRQVVEIATGVAVVAEHSWAALKGREALSIEWDEGPNAGLSSKKISQRLAEADPAAAPVMREEGDAKTAFQSANKTAEAVYELPYISHSPMEPMNCTARITGDRCEVWAPIQSVTWGQNVAADTAGVPRENVTIQPTYAGGGFGRRLMVDYVAETVEIAKKTGLPIQMFMTREDDTRHGMFRPTSRHTLKAALDANGKPLAWTHHLASPSISGQLNPDRFADGRDEGAVNGAENIPYEIPNLEVTYSMVNTAVPICWLRSVYNTQNGLANECFFDEMAQVGGHDPVELRLDLLPKDARLRGTLERAKKEWGWPRKLANGRGQGVASHSSFASHVTMMAEVSADKNGWPTVHEILCVVDCGPVVHPDGLNSQIEGVVGFALSALLREEITIDQGRVQQSNFDDYPMMRLDEMPAVKVVTIDSEDDIGGIGEPGYPPLGPAVLNALCDATGVRIRKLPLAGNLKA